MQKQDIRSMLPEELETAIKSLGEKPFRAKQIFGWLTRGAESFDEMTNLSQALQETLDANFTLAVPELADKQTSEDGTVKYLWQLEDGNCVETVLMRYHHGNTVCISTQVGCRMGCTFCASAIGGLVRNLKPSEMLGQVIFTAKDSGLTISNVVLMGIGEPLDNFDNVLCFLKLVNHPDGLHIGMRHITLSTCGLAEVIDKLGEHNIQLTLTVSLHAPDDETRNRLVPMNRKWGIDVLMAACKRYFKRTGRRISFEYAMVDGVNDTPEHAELLAKRMSDAGGHVNLIPLNPIAERSLGPSGKTNLDTFTETLRRRGVNVTVRRSLGRDIDAACGQLRKRREKEEKSL
ncbi:MAG: 23S rRNA (adenine(2503)-C(2))-methyltransferase RlmN [Oscillospiraceae bacterium]|nr:23S rRNA (adenine(2503)-C(2))-methyltransferase RlmN [Oscillospiraceae bacterium]